MKRDSKNWINAVTFCLIATASCMGPTPCIAASYTSRITLGAFVSNESFNEALDGQTQNDFAIISSRFFFKGSDVGSYHLDLVADLRDKNDFFEKLDRELLTLAGVNTFQLRQVSARIPSDRPGLSGAFGRFPIPEAGSVNVDGAEVGYRFNDSVRTAFFGGFNPKQSDQSYLQFNSNSQTFGTYTLYQPRAQSWSRYVYSSNAAVGQVVQGHLDRFYLFDNTIYQWREPNQISALIYLDCTPRIYFQTAFISWVQEYYPGLISTTNALAIDVIEYFRRENVLETLAPSPYKEGNYTLRKKIGNQSALQGFASWGIREIDGLIKREFSIGPAFNQIFGPHFSGQALFGYRKNFTADEDFFRLNFGYYSRLWELTLDLDAGYRLESTSNVYHPAIAEVGVARYFSRELYGTIAVQRAQDEKVGIWSSFFRLGYRMGSEGVAPLRDGAPPRGRL